LKLKGVDCKFLNFGINIKKALKLHELINFPKKKKKEEEEEAWLDQ
jgi:hypothetical protein